MAKEKTKRRDIRYEDPTWEDYRDDLSRPRSYLKLILAYVKNFFHALIHHFPSTVIPLIIVYIGVFWFNIWFWSILNDTMWVGRGTVGTNQFAPYLVGGGVFEGTAYKGVSPFDKPGETLTGTLVAPFAFAMGILIPRLLFRIIHSGPLAPIKDLLSIAPLRKHYEEKRREKSKKQEKQEKGGSNIYFLTGLVCAAVAGFLIRNPFAVLVFAIIFFASFGQGAESEIGRGIFVVKMSNKKLNTGWKKEIPYYCDGMLWLFYLAVGFGIYTILNTILWFLLDYNFYARLIATVALIAGCFVLAGKGRKKMAGVAIGFIAVVGFLLWLDRLTALADDGGWSESGRSVKGLRNNSGWKQSSSSARSPGISGDSAALMAQIQRYQNFLQKKAAQGQPLSDTDYEVMKRLNQKVRDLKAGKTVSANEMESLRKILYGSNVGQMSGNVNEQVKTPTVMEDLGTAGAQTFEEVARGETVKAKAARGLMDVATGGASEMVFTPAGAAYGMQDYVNAGGTSAFEAGLNEVTKVVADEAVSYAGGKAGDYISKNALKIPNAKPFKTLDSPKVNIGGVESKVFSGYNTFQAAGARSISYKGQAYFAARSGIDYTTKWAVKEGVQQLGSAAGAASVHAENAYRNMVGPVEKLSSSATLPRGIGISADSGTQIAAMRASGLYGWHR